MNVLLGRAVRQAPLRVTTVLAFALLLALGAPASAQTTVNFWFFDAEWVQGEEFVRLAREFERQNPDIRIEATSLVGAGYEDVIITNVAAGTQPDIAFFNRTRVVERAVQGLFEPLDELLDPGVRAAWNPALIGEVTHRGSIWALPISFDMRGMLWNNRLLTEAGLDADRGPEHFDDLREFAVKLLRTEADGQIRQLGFFPGREAAWQVIGWMWTFGGEVHDWERGRPDVVRPQNLAALEWVNSYTEITPMAQVEAFLQPYGNAQNAFANEVYAMVPGPSAFVASWRQNYPDLDYSVGRVPHPEGGRNGSWAGGGSIVIPRGAPNAEAAARFLNFLGSVDSQLAYYEASLNFPGNMEALTSIETDDPVILGFVEQANELNLRAPLWGDYLSQLHGVRDRILRGEAAPSMALLEEVQRLLDVRFDTVGF